jgi:citrate synthase
MNEIREVIAATFQIPVASVADDASNQTIPQWDSLGHITLVMALEQRFNVSFTLDEIVEMRDLPTIQRLLAGKRS